MRKTVLLLALVAMMLLCVAVARADKDDDGPKSEDEKRKDDDDRKERRKIEYKLGEEEFKIESSTRDGGSSRSRIEFSFKAKNPPRFLLSYKAKSDDTVVNVANRWTILKVIEYNSSEANAALARGSGAFQVVRRYLLKGEDKQWTKLAADPTAPAGVVSACASFTNVAPNNFTATVCAYAAEALTPLNRTTIDPRTLKWSFSLRNFQYTQADTRVALKVSFSSRQNANRRPGSNRTLVLDSDSNGGVVAKWSPSVNITGSGCPATASVVSSELLREEPNYDKDKDSDDVTKDLKDDVNTNSRSFLYFSYVPDNASCQPSTITWDPEMSFSTSASTGSSTNGSSGIVPSLAALFLAVLVALLA